ncbi:DedA family protein [Effusibacillus pohliae]|uniref:DedA family protein n=1 Tax=Effusibacillus pohliae TaxID=232270 RepID=UPI0024816B54|nr:DedA family protein [Effusibacillus pohliae]
MIGIPLPGETALTLAGIAWMSGTFSFVPLFLTAVSGNFLGASIAYFIGRFLGRPAILRYGRYAGMTEERMKKAEDKFLRYRLPLLLFSRFIAGVRVLVPYLAGMNGIPFWMFSFYNFVGAAVWCSAFVILGRYADIAWHRYHQVMHQYFLPAVLFAALAVGVCAGIKIKKKQGG